MKPSPLALPLRAALPRALVAVAFVAVAMALARGITVGGTVHQFTHGLLTADPSRSATRRVRGPSRGAHR